MYAQLHHVIKVAETQPRVTIRVFPLAPEQVVRKLAQADRMLGEGKDVADVCRELGVSEQTYYRWRNQFGGLKADDVKRLKDLEKENSTLKRLLADAELEKAALKEIARGNF
jgi:putative transposase